MAAQSGEISAPPQSRVLQPIGELVWREHGIVAGTVRSVCVQPRAGLATLEATVFDASGGVTVVLLGRRRLAGLRPGAHLRLEGVVGDHHGKLAFLNPSIHVG